MATYVNDLRLKEITTGDEAGTWGTSTNTNLELIAEAFSYGTEASFSSDADATTTIADGATDPARSLYLKVTSGVSLTATRTLTIAPNTVSKVWIIENATSGSQSINISQGSGANVTIPNGDVKVVYSDGAGSGAAVVDAFTDLNLGGTTTVAALDAGSGAITTTGTVTGNNLAGTLTTAAQPNITSVGTLTGFTSTGIDDNASSTTITIDASNRVNIGKASSVSGKPLEVQANTSGQSLGLYGRASDGLSYLGFFANGANTEYASLRADNTSSLSVRTNGTERLKIDSSGNVGIGTASPSTELHVKNAADCTLLLQSGDGSTAEILFGDASDTSRGKIKYLSTDEMTFEVNNLSEAIRIDSSGRLLVASSTAVTGNTTAKLQINGTDNSGSTISIGRFSNNANAPVLNFIKSRNGTVGGNTIVQDGDNLGSILFGGNDGTDNVSIGAKIFGEVDGTPGSNDMPGRLTFFTTADGAASPTERMRIDSDGDIGINTTSPISGSKLDVVDSDDMTMRVRSTGASSAAIRYQNSNTGTTTGDGLFVGIDASANAYHYNYENTASIFATNNTEAMRIDSSGNVGIGTSSTTNDAKLIVVGSDGKHPTIKTNDSGANGFTMLADNYTATESQVNFGVGFSSSDLVLSRCVKPSDSAEKVYLSSQAQAACKPAALVMSADGDFRFLNTNTNATTAVDTAVSLSERMRIRSDGGVGIGQAGYASTILSLHNGTGRSTLIYGESGDANCDISLRDSSSTQNIAYGAVGNNHIFKKDSTEHMRIDSSGLVSIGTTSAHDSNALLTLSKSAVASSVLKSTTNTVTFANVANGSASIAYSGTASNHPYYFMTNGTERMRINTNGRLLIGGTADRGAHVCVGGDSNTARVIPMTDNVGYVGEAAFRWQAIYAVTSTIQTSDEREKTEIKETTLGLDFIKDLKPVSYKWIDGEQLNKGKDKREHQGLIAQQVAETVEKHGIDKNTFGGLDIQKTEKYDDFHGMSYDQFVAPLIKAIQEQQTQIEALQSEINLLKGE